MYDNVTLERNGRIAIVTMQRPDRRNSLSDPMLTDLSSALRKLVDDGRIGAVVLTGAPPVFSAGADSPSLKSATSEADRRQVFGSRKTQFRRLFGRVTNQLEQLDQPVICAVNGHAVGGGWGLTLGCDFRFAAAEAQFWLPEVDLGTPLGVGSTMRLVRMAGEAMAKEIIMGCARYTAEQVKEMGLLHRVVPKDFDARGHGVCPTPSRQTCSGADAGESQHQRHCPHGCGPSGRRVCRSLDPRGLAPLNIANSFELG